MMGDEQEPAQGQHSDDQNGDRNGLDETPKAAGRKAAPRDEHGRFMPSAKSKRGTRPGGQPGNTNAQVHGLRSCMVLGKLPKHALNLQRNVERLRLELEATVLEVHGVVGPREVECINALCRCEQGAGLARLWLHQAGDDLKPAERLAFLDRIVKFTEARSKLFEKLRLDKNPDDIASLLYGPPIAVSGDANPSGGEIVDPGANTGDSGDEGGRNG